MQGNDPHLSNRHSHSDHHNVKAEARMTDHDKSTHQVYTLKKNTWQHFPFTITWKVLNKLMKMMTV